MPTATPKAEDVAWARVVEAAKKEDRVIIYTFTMVGDIGLAVTKAFKEKYGITLEVIMGGAQSFLEKLYLMTKEDASRASENRQSGMMLKILQESK